MLWWLASVVLLYTVLVPEAQSGDTASSTYRADEVVQFRGLAELSWSPQPPKPVLPPGIQGTKQPGSYTLHPFVIVKDDPLSAPAQTHWYEPPNPLGLETFTSEKLPWIAKDAIGFRYTGPLRASFAAELRQALLATPRKYDHVLLELDSDGGDLAYVKEIVGVLKEVRLQMTLTTRVTEGSLCASGCIPIFMQGQIRKASGSSIWVFHGARSALTNIPNPSATDEYLDLLTEAGMTPAFRKILSEDNRIYRPGSFILSGHELFDIYKSGIITELMPTWREETPLFPSGIGPH